MPTKKNSKTATISGDSRTLHISFNTPIQDGYHSATIKEIENLGKKVIKGEERIVLQITFMTSSHKTIKTQIIVTEEPYSKFWYFLLATKGDTSGDVVLDDLLDLSCQILVETKKQNGRLFKNIVQILPLYADDDQADYVNEEEYRGSESEDNNDDGDAGDDDEDDDGDEDDDDEDDDGDEDDDDEDDDDDDEDEDNDDF